MAALVIGYGNTLRGDDGVGYRVAERIEQLHWPHVKAIACHQLSPELMAEFAEFEHVIFVDATLPGHQQQPSVTAVEGLKATTLDTHQVTPETLICLAAELYGCRPKATKVLLPTQAMDFGEELSAIAQEGLEAAIQYIQNLLESPEQKPNHPQFEIGSSPHS